MENLILSLYIPNHINDSQVIECAKEWASVFIENKCTLIDPELWRIKRGLEIAVDYEVIRPLAPLNFESQIFGYPEQTLSIIAASIHIALATPKFSKNLTKNSPIVLETNCNTHSCCSTNEGLKEIVKIKGNVEEYKSNECKMIDSSLQNINNNLIYTLECYNLLDIVQASNIHTQLLKIILINIPTTGFDTLRSSTVGCLASICGQIQRISAINPRVKSIFFKCLSCKGHFFQSLLEGKFYMPTKCVSNFCNSSKFKIVKHHSKICNHQTIRVQEYYRDSSDKPPTSIDIELYGSMINNCMPGSIVTIVGIVKASRMMQDRYRKGPSQALLNIYLQAVSMTSGDENIEGDKAIVDLRYNNFIRHLHLNEPFRYHLIASSICKNIIGRPYLKAGLLLCLLGGTPVFNQRGGLVKRGNAHCLLIGEPGVGKSKILRGVCNLAKKGHYFSGGSVSSSGLTAYLIRETDSLEFTIEAGALILSDGGICCIDELDKTSQLQQHSFLESMEQQTVSISKAGVVCTLSARCTLICAANPKMGKFSHFKPLIENITLSFPLINRFDLLFLLRDGDSTFKIDSRISNSILKINETKNDNCLEDYKDEVLNSYEKGCLGDKIAYFENCDDVPNQLIQAYIKYANSLPVPKFTNSSAKIIKEYFKSLKAKSPLPVTVRQLEALIRLSQARARGDFSEIIEDEYAQEIVELYNHTLYNYNKPNVERKVNIGIVSHFVKYLVNMHGNKLKNAYKIKELEDMAKYVIEKYNSSISVDSLINIANYNGFIIKTTNGWEVVP